MKNKYNDIILFICFLIILLFCTTRSFNANSEIYNSSNTETYFYKVESDYFEKSKQNIGLNIVDYIEIELDWNKINQESTIEGKLSFPFIPNNLAIVIMTDYEYIAHGNWKIENNNCLNVYFNKDDIDYFREKEIVYIILLEFDNGLYFDIY